MENRRNTPEKIAFLEQFPFNVRETLDLAYDFGRTAERDFDHAQAVAFTLKDVGVDDPSILAGALMHHIPESNSFFGNPESQNYAKPSDINPNPVTSFETMRDRISNISRYFEPEVAEIVLVNARPTGKELGKNEKERDWLEEENMRKASAEARLVKLAHILTIVRQATSQEQVDKALEEFDRYFDILSGGKTPYSAEVDLLLKHITLAEAFRRNQLDPDQA